MEGLTHYLKDVRPWGTFERFTLNEKSTAKIITVNEGEAFSLQTHDRRDEFWYIVKGTGNVRVGDKESEAHEGDTFFIPRHTEHRASGGLHGMTFLEIAFGEFEESDIHRLEDNYGRV